MPLPENIWVWQSLSLTADSEFNKESHQKLRVQSLNGSSGVRETDDFVQSLHDLTREGARQEQWRLSRLALLLFFSMGRGQGGGHGLVCPCHHVPSPPARPLGSGSHGFGNADATAETPDCKLGSQRQQRFQP